MENLNHQYSIAIIPPPEIIKLVKSYKDLLASNIGTYKSRNSIAHITIKEFFANEKELEVTIKQLQRSCNSLNSISIKCTHFDSYPSNKTIFIKPDLESKINLLKIMKKIQNETNIKSNHISSDPHISIGRGILKYEKALEILNFSLNIHFDIDNIVLRKFNTQIKQYDIYKTFPFMGLTDINSEQLSLF